MKTVRSSEFGVRSERIKHIWSGVRGQGSALNEQGSWVMGHGSGLKALTLCAMRFAPRQRRTLRSTLYALRSAKGFTLIELMIVIVIIGILATLLVPRIMDRPEEARRIKAKTDIKTIESALKLYKLDNGGYPTTEQGLQALIKKPDTPPIPRKWKEGGYLESTTVPKDPWDNPYYFSSPATDGKDYEIISYGSDGEPGGTGKNADISSKDIEKE